jgi:hypothetical protein
MSPPVPAFGFKPEIDRSYLVFCPEHGGWHVGEWWTIDGPGRWMLAYDASVELIVSHVIELPPDPMDTSGVIQWALGLQLSPGGASPSGRSWAR